MNELNKKLYFKVFNKLPPERIKKTDPLSKYPLRLCAYSNEVGAAISPINPTLGIVLWVPALLYLGADIYDKYKNEDKIYNPSPKRSLRQAIFQGLASVILPTAAIKAGQKIGVHVAGEKGALSATDKKELIEFTRGFLYHSDYPKENNNDIIEGLVSAFKRKALINEKRINKKGFLSKILSFFAEPKGPEHTMVKYLKNKSDSNPVIRYLEEQAMTARDIMTSEKAIKAEKYLRYFEKSNLKYENASIARKDTVLKILKDKNINKSLVATLSGFIALILLAKPIDYFVEDVLMEKLVNPFLDKTIYKNKTKQN